MRKSKLKNKLKNKRNTNEYGLGGLIGTGIGAIGGAFLGNPMLGAQIGGALGGGIDGIVDKNKHDKNIKRQKELDRILNLTRSSGSLGMRYGGKLLKRGGPISNYTTFIGQDALKFVGPSHEEGGIPLPNTNAEVEGGETMDNIDGSDYIFSEKLIVPDTNKSFADVHEELVQSGASEEEIAQLAQLQEQVAGRTKKRFGGALRKKYGIRK